MDGGRHACVLGATGFIGRSAVAVLAEAGFRVRAAVRHPGGPLPPELRAQGVEVVQADVADAASLEAAVAGVEVVVNCAGVYRWWVPDPEEYRRVNVLGAGNVARACLGSQTVSRLVHVSTAMAYGFPSERPFREDSVPGPHASEYARSKHLGDLEVAAATRGQSKLAVVVLFLACVTGRGDTLSVGRPAAVYRDFMLGKIPLLVAPDTSYIYVHIRDVQQAVLASSTLPAASVAGQGYLIGNSADKLTTRQYFQMLSRHTGRPCPTMSLNLFIGYWLAWLLTLLSTQLTRAEPTAPLDVMRTARWGSIEYDCGKSVAELGISYTPIEVAVAEAVADVKERMAAAAAPPASAAISKVD